MKNHFKNWKEEIDKSKYEKEDEKNKANEGGSRERLLNHWQKSNLNQKMGGDAWPEKIASGRDKFPKKWKKGGRRDQQEKNDKQS